MSGLSDEEISSADRRGFRGGGSDVDDDDDDDPEIGKTERRRKGSGFGKEIGKAVRHQFSKANKKLRRIRSKKPLLPSQSSNARTKGSGKMIIGGDGSGIRCRFCFSRPRVLESPNESPTSDPNDPNFTQTMLKSLIEKNDFYSKECNPHLD